MFVNKRLCLARHRSKSRLRRRDSLMPQELPTLCAVCAMLQPNLNVPTEQLQHFRDPGCSIGSSRRKSRLWRRRNYHARGLIVTEEVPCRGPGKRATHFAKCLVHVGTILAHLAATSLSTATSSATLVSTASPRGRRKKLPSTFPAAPSRSTRLVSLRHKMS